MKGLRIPVGVGPSGGAALVEGDENDAKIIKLSLGSDENENAFQQNIALDQGMVFDLNDPTIRLKIIRRIEKIFDIFKRQKRFKLFKNSIKWSENAYKQELILKFKYLNLESDEEVNFTRTFTSAD